MRSCSRRTRGSRPSRSPAQRSRPTAPGSTRSRRTTRSFSPPENARTRRIAEATDQPGFGSSYAHLPGTVGEAWTEFDGDYDGVDGVVDAFREARPRTVVHRGGIGHQLRGLVEFAHLAYENTWEKLDRQFLSGDEPTLPSNVAYEGRFNDVSVYSGTLSDYRPK